MGDGYGMSGRTPNSHGLAGTSTPMSELVRQLFRMLCSMDALDGREAKFW
jgi:hypothetical protein